MSNTEQVIKRFSCQVTFQGRRTEIRPTYQSNRFLQDLIEQLVADDGDTLSLEVWSRLFLKGILRTYLVHQFLMGDRPLVASAHIAISLHNYLCTQLLFCYLQPVCWKAAFRVSDQLRRSPNTALHYPQVDCFAIASVHSTQSGYLLRRFDFNSGVSLEGYAFGALQKATKNQIARELKSKSIKFSNYGLLRNVSQRKVERSLRALGIAQAEQQLHILVWKSFNGWVNDGSTASGSQRNPLTPIQADQVAERCRKQAGRLGLEQASLTCSGVQRMLETCIKAVQQDDTMQTLSLDAGHDGSSQDSPVLESVITLPDPATTEESDASDLEQFRQTVIHAFGTLELTAQGVLMLWLGLGINQIDFAPLLKVQKQYQVARQLQRYQRTLLKAVMQGYRQANPEARFTDQQINKVCREQLSAIKDYLETYSQGALTRQLESIVLDQAPQDARLALRAFADQAAALVPSERQALPLYPEAIALKKQFKTAIEAMVDIQIGQFQSSEACLDTFIKAWLVQNQALLDMARH